MAEDKYFSKHFFLGLLFILIFLAVFVISHILTALFTGGVLAYIFFPIYKWLSKKTKSKSLSAWILLVVTVLIILVPLYLISGALTKEGFTLFITVKQKSDWSQALTEL